MKIGEIDIQMNGFIAEHKTYLYEASSQEEAHYLTAILNSSYAFSVLKRIKAARDIEKKIWELPIPDFNHTDKVHTDLYKLRKDCAIKANTILQEELKFYFYRTPCILERLVA